MTDWRKLRGKRVTVHASGVAYRGTVVEIGLHSLLLRAPEGFREVPWERINSVVEEGASPSAAPSALSGRGRGGLQEEPPSDGEGDA